MQAIQTVYHGPTNHRGSRVTAKCQAGRHTVAWDYSLSVEDNHANAAQALAIKLGWTKATHGALYGGQLPSGDYAFVFESKYSVYCFAPDKAA